MKTIVLWGVGLVSLLLLQEVRAQQAKADIGPDWQSHSVLSIVTNSQGAVTYQTNVVVELGGGMNRWDAALGQWVACVPELTITDDGVIAQGARHQVRFAANLNTAAATQVLLPGNGASQWLKMHILGLFYEDTAARTNVLIADLQDSAAQVVGAQVYYLDALSGVRADVRYSYSRSGVSQEILIRERLPAPETYAMNADSVQLVAITEVVEGPEPQQEDRVWQSGQVTERDEGLDFGTMRMVPGLAFRLGGEGEVLSGIPVTKEYRTAEGRRIILERVRYSRMQNQLLHLPAIGGSTNGTASIKKAPRWLAQGYLPPPPKSSPNSIRAARATPFIQSDGFVLDWDLVSSALTDFTFKGAPGVTYVIASDTWLSGTTTINPGAILRFDSGSLYVDGPLSLVDGTSRRGSQRPILTSVYDESVGPAVRSRELQGLGQHIPALVVSAQDYTNAARQIEIRHPAVRISPDRPTDLPSVRIERTGPRGPRVSGQAATFRVRRVGGDRSQALTVGFRLNDGVQNGLDSQIARFSVIIPPNEDTAEVSIPAIVGAAQPQSPAQVLTIEPDPTGSYIADGPLSAIVSAPDPVGMSPMSMQTPDGLAGWWKAEGNANDSSGGNHDGSFNGASCVAGWIGQAFNFDGIDDFIQIADSPALRFADAMTVEFWVKRSRLTGAPEYLIEKGGDWNSGHQNYAVSIHPNNGLCFTWDWGYRIGGAINDYQWHHCAVTARKDDADPVLYIDGWPQAITGRQAAAITLNTSSYLPLHIGAQVDASWNYYSQTMIDEMSIYNQALSQKQIQSIFNVGRAGKTIQMAVCTPAPSGLVSWWRAESNANDSVGGNHGTFGGLYMGGQVGQTFRIVDSTSVVSIPSSATLNVGTGSGFTIEGWINVYDDDTGGHPVFEWAGANYGVHVWVNYASLGSVFVNIFDTGGNSHYFWAFSAGIQSKTFQHLAVSYDHTTGNCQIFVNGSLIMTQPVGVVTPQTSLPLYIGYRPANLGGGPRTFNGVIDEVSLYNRALSSTEIQAIYAAQSAGKCTGSQPVPPSITTQPANQVLSIGGTVSFSVIATGTAPLSYQWKHDGANVAGATTSTYTKSNVQVADGGTYTVLISNAGGSVTSSGATLTILPLISGQPLNQATALGGMATFSVVATGTSPLSYQWINNGTSIAGATSSIYSKSNVQLSDAGSYTVQVSNSGGSAISTSAVLTILPSITTQPAAQIVALGATATFNVAATGTAPLSYQWKKDGLVISGATASVYSKSNVQTADGGTYTVDVSNVGGVTTAGGVALIILPSIISQPASQAVALGGVASFTVQAAGTLPLNFQWKKDGIEIAGATVPTYTKSNVQSSDAGNYTVLVSNPGGSVPSGQATLTVNAAPKISTQPVSQAVAPGATASFTVVATGAAPLSYQWKVNGIAIAGATSATFIKSNVQPSDAGNYTVLVSNPAGSISSAQASLAVTAVPVILTQPVSQTLVQGANATFIVVAGPAPLNYQWFHNGTQLAGASAATLTVNNVLLSDGGDYLVRVSNANGAVSSLPAVLTIQQEGEKHVIAMKAWHGAQPFTYDDGMEYGSWPSLDRPTTRYCTATGSGTWNRDGSTATCSRSASVNATTGLVSGTGSDSGLNGAESSYCRDKAAALAVGLSMAAPLWLKSLFDNATPLFWRDGGSPGCHGAMRTSMLVDTATCKKMDVFFAYDTGDTRGEHKFIHAEWDGAAGTFMVDYWGWGFDNYSRTWSTEQTGHEEASIASTHSSYIGWSGGSSGPHQSWTGTGDLLVPYTWTQLNNEVDDLLSIWDLSRDGDWQSYCYDGPLVSRNERDASLPLCRNAAGSWTDSTTPMRPQFVDGAILGAPSPRGTPPYEDELTGELSPFPQATQWFSAVGSIKSTPVDKHFSAGAWINFESAVDSVPARVVFFPGYLMKAKWAQIKNVHPSYNYFRPCGADRDLRDRQGNLRFPTAWPICGRIVVAGATQAGGYVDLLLGEEAPYLRDADRINVTGVAGLGSDLVVTQPDPDNHWVFRVPGTLSGSYSSGGYVQSTGSPAYTWNDDSPKGDFTFVKLPGPRAAPVCSQGNLADSPGALSVQYISTHAESFPNGAFYSIDSVTPSIADGAFWQGYCYSTMPDPLDPALPRVEARCSPRPGAPALPVGSTFGSLDAEPPSPNDCKLDENILAGHGVNIDIERNNMPVPESDEDSNGSVVQIVPTANPSGLYPQGIFLGISDISFEPASLAHLFTLKLKKVYPADPVTHKLMSPGKIRIYKRSQGETEFSMFMDSDVDEKLLNPSLLSPNTEWKLDSTAGGVVDIAIIAEYPAGTEVDRDTVRVSSIPCAPDIYGNIIFVNPMSWLAEPLYDNFSQNAAHSIADAIAIMQPDDNILIARPPDNEVYPESGMVLTAGGVIAGLGGQWTVSDPSTASWPASDWFDFKTLPAIDSGGAVVPPVFRANGLNSGTQLLFGGIRFQNAICDATESLSAGTAIRLENLSWTPVLVSCCRFATNAAFSFGGAIYLKSVANATLQYSQFESNQVIASEVLTDQYTRGMGGAIASIESYLEVKNTSFNLDVAQVVGGSVVSPALPPAGCAGGGGDIYLKNGTLNMLRSRSRSAIAGFPRSKASNYSPRDFTGDGGSILLHGRDASTGLQMSECLFEASLSYGNGGAISLSYDSSPIGRAYVDTSYTPPHITPMELGGFCSGTLENVTFNGCNGGWQGGCVSINGRGMRLALIGCGFYNSRAGSTHTGDGKGGAIGICGGLQINNDPLVPSNWAQVSLQSCDIDTCRASGNAGGIYFTIRAGLQLEDCTISGCWAQNEAGSSQQVEGQGGAFHASAGAVGELTGCAFDSNDAAANGGAISVKSASIDLHDTVNVSFNRALGAANAGWGNGGGIYVTTSAYEAFAGFAAAELYNNDGNIQSYSSDVLVNNNVANRWGGGLYAGISYDGFDGAYVVMDYASFSLNSALTSILHGGQTLAPSQIATERVQSGTTGPTLEFGGAVITGGNPGSDIGIYQKTSVGISGGTPSFSPGTLAQQVVTEQ